MDWSGLVLQASGGGIDAGLAALIVIAVVVAAFALIGLYVNRYKKVPTDTAMVIYGSKVGLGQRGFTVIRGGGKFVYPGIHSVAYMSLAARALGLTVHDIITDVTRSGAKINIEAVATVKIGEDEPYLSTAAGALLSMNDQEINSTAQRILEGHVRGICAKMTVEEINSRRETVVENVQSDAAKDLSNLGVKILSFVIKEIGDPQGYLEALGARRTAEVKRDARIGQANANREATIREAEAARDAEKANADAEARVAEFHRDRDLVRQKAEGIVEVERANKEIAFELQNSIRQQELVKQRVQIEIEERQKRIELQEKEIIRKEKEQVAAQIVPAKAEADAKVATAEGDKGKTIKLAEGNRERARIEAEGERDRLVLVATGQSEQMKKVAEGQAEQIRRQGQAEADIIKTKGLAEADAIRAKGLATAEAMERKAEAWKKYGNAAVIQMIVEQLPEITKQAALPLQGVEKMIILGSEGPAGLVEKSIGVAAQVPALVKSLTGLDITQIIGRVSEITKGSGKEGGEGGH